MSGSWSNRFESSRNQAVASTLEDQRFIEESSNLGVSTDADWNENLTQINSLKYSALEKDMSYVAVEWELYTELEELESDAQSEEFGGWLRRLVTWCVAWTFNGNSFESIVAAKQEVEAVDLNDQLDRFDYLTVIWLILPAIKSSVFEWYESGEYINPREFNQKIDAFEYTLPSSASQAPTLTWKYIMELTEWNSEAAKYKDRYMPWLITDVKELLKSAVLSHNRFYVPTAQEQLEAHATDHSENAKTEVNTPIDLVNRLAEEFDESSEEDKWFIDSATDALKDTFGSLKWDNFKNLARWTGVIITVSTLWYLLSKALFTKEEWDSETTKNFKDFWKYAWVAWFTSLSWLIAQAMFHEDKDELTPVESYNEVIGTVNNQLNSKIRWLRRHFCTIWYTTEWEWDAKKEFISWYGGIKTQISTEKKKIIWFDHEFATVEELFHFANFLNSVRRRYRWRCKNNSPFSTSQNWSAFFNPNFWTGSVSVLTAEEWQKTELFGGLWFWNDAWVVKLFPSLKDQTVRDKAIWFLNNHDDRKAWNIFELPTRSSAKEVQRQIESEWWWDISPSWITRWPIHVDEVWSSVLRVSSWWQPAMQTDIVAIWWRAGKPIQFKLEWCDIIFNVQAHPDWDQTIYEKAVFEAEKEAIRLANLTNMLKFTYEMCCEKDNAFEFKDWSFDWMNNWSWIQVDTQRNIYWNIFTGQEIVRCLSWNAIINNYPYLNEKIGNVSKWELYTKYLNTLQHPYGWSWWKSQTN